MSHFAKVVDGIVTQVIVAEPEFFETFVDNTPGIWVQTSYNTRGGVHYDPQTGEPSADQSKALRKNYAGIGYLYHSDLDLFSPPKPFNSWQLNTITGLWDPPFPAPENTDPKKYYKWDEITNNWVLYNWNESTNSWVLGS
jgi:hypothetical protein